MQTQATIQSCGVLSHTQIETENTEAVDSVNHAEPE
jgi:hypothetical protein